MRATIRKDLIKKFYPAYRYNQFIKESKEPKIIHYVGEYKPWHYPHIEMAHYYWNTIRDTELYELALKSQIDNIQYKYSTKIINDFLNEVI